MVKKTAEIKTSIVCGSASVGGLSMKKKKRMNKGAWTAEEDQKLIQYVNIHGDKKWRHVPSQAGLNRCGKSCRLRWLNYLRPGIKRGNITEDEEDLIIRLHNLLGNRWSLIAGRLPGRTDNEIKNHWNTHLSKKPLTIDELNLKLNQKLGSKDATDQPLLTIPCNDKPSNELSNHYYSSCGIDSNTNELLEKNDHLDVLVEELFEGSSLMEGFDPLVGDLMIDEERMFQNLLVQDPFGNCLQEPTGMFDHKFYWNWNNVDLMI